MTRDLVGNAAAQAVRERLGSTAQVAVEDVREEGTSVLVTLRVSPVPQSLVEKAGAGEAPQF